MQFLVWSESLGTISLHPASLQFSTRLVRRTSPSKTKVIAQRMSPARRQAPLTFDLAVRKSLAEEPQHLRVTSVSRGVGAHVAALCEQLLGAASSSSSSSLSRHLLLLTGASECPPLFATHNEGWIL